MIIKIINNSNLCTTNISCFPRRLQRKNFLSSKTSRRRPQDVIVIRLLKMSSRRLEDVVKTFSRRLQDVFQDIFKTCLQDIFFKTSLRCLQEDVLQLCLEDVLKYKKCYTEDAFKTSSPRRMFSG